MNIKNINKTTAIFLLLILCLLTLTSARRPKCRTKKPDPLELASIHIIDRNGLSETLSGKDRLKQFECVDFLKSQPYQKVLRIYVRDSAGNIRSVVTTYYENGSVKQFLEILNGRAKGSYFEWHENGVMSLSAHVIGGSPDVTPLAEKTWLFEGISRAWDENGKIIAENIYSKGSLEGISTYYHPCGNKWKIIPYCKNEIEGTVEFLRSDSQLLQKINYEKGKKNGPATRYWDSENIASAEEYVNGKLMQAKYFDQQGNVVAEIIDGTGYRAVFGKNHITELQEFQEGVLEGQVKFFNSKGKLQRTYKIRNGIKHGEEIEYFPQLHSKEPLTPRFSFNWNDGKIQGLYKSWYRNGNQKSQKEMANSAKNGILTVWYRDGKIMMIEEYESNKLIRGDYFKKDERFPVSQVIQGKGTVTIFDGDGHFVEKIKYNFGKPDQ